MAADRAQLPERLRQRVVLLVAAVLPSVAPLPPPLRKIAGFAPARRGRLGAAPIWAALQDDDFRRHAAVQVAATDAITDDVVDAAARSWLSRGAGWESVVDRAVLHDRGVEDDRDAGARELERLTALVTSLQAEVAAARSEGELRAEQAKAEHSVLRRRLGEARAALRVAEASRDEAVEALARATVTAEQDARAAAEDVRRLRGELDEAERDRAELGGREGRSARDTATIRARYLLETVIEASTGLRRELGLPALDGMPGDDVESALALPGRSRRTTAPASAAALDHLLSMPRSRLLVDGYNVTKGIWASASLEAQRSRLVSALAPLVARTGAETTVVFDGGAAGMARAATPSPRGVRVVFSPEGVIADDVVRQLVHAEPRGRVVVVVTDDHELGDHVVRAGARLVPVAALVELVSG